MDETRSGWTGTAGRHHLPYAAIVAGLLMAVLPPCAAEAGVNGERLLTFDDRGYTFSLWFTTDLPRDTLMNVLYAFPHVRKYAVDEGEASVLREQDTTYEVAIEYSSFLYSSRSIVKRTRSSERGAVLVDIVDFWQDNTTFPDLRASHAEFRLTAVEGGFEIDYQQTAQFDDPLNWVYAQMTKARLYAFADNLLRYIDTVAAECRAGEQQDCDGNCRVRGGE